MPSRTLDQLDSDIDDARTTVEELRLVHQTNATDKKLDVLQEALEHASDDIDDLETQDE